MSQEKFLGVINVDTTAAATTLCNYNSKAGDDRKQGTSSPIPASRVACHSMNKVGSGMSLLKCNYVH